MRALIFSVLLFGCYTCSGQDKSTDVTFMSASALVGFYNGGNTIGGSVGVGQKGKVLGLGIGADIVKFKDVTNIYFPLYFDLKYYPPSNNSDIFLSLQGGYGVYHNEQKAGVSTVSQNGGLYFSPGIGFRSRKKLAPVFSLRYSSYEIKTKVSGVNVNQSSSNRINAVTIVVGISTYKQSK